MDRGMLFVAATLLPLLSFLLILLASALRAAIRPYREQPGCAGLYQLLGGDKSGLIPAYVATSAMALAFVFSLIGFLQHKTDEGDAHEIETKIELIEAQAQKTGQDHEETKKKTAPLEEEIANLRSKWEGKVTWANVGWYTHDEKGERPEAAWVTAVQREKRREADPQFGVKLSLGYYVDNLTTIMFLMVTLIATLIHIFSMGYMSEELVPVVTDHHVHTEDGHLHRRGRFGRFFMFLSLFCFSMLSLVLADNLFQVFVSWELVGICSYLLIGFYYERTSAANAANKAFITNRIGDAGFIIGLMIVWTYIGTFNFQEIFQQVRSPLSDTHTPRLALAGKIVTGTVLEDQSDEIESWVEVNEDGTSGDQVILFPAQLPDHFHGVNPDHEPQFGVPGKRTREDYGLMPYWLLVAAGLGIFMGCIGKSAQFPLQVWLPDAMEGPTPVSALIHAATMVAAGVYLVGRVYPMFPEEVRLVIAYVGGITLFVAATIAIVQTDIKKVLAYSTVSQLGYMILALGVGGWAVGLFHLITHAFFKALLFLGSGSVIFGCHHEQEMTKMGGLFKKMPITALTMLVGCLAIMGFPFTAGWYSKDGIIAHAFGYTAVHPEHMLLLLLPLITAGITTFYMFRMWFMTFTGEPRDQHVYEHAAEAPRVMTVPLIVLAVFSVGVGWGWPFWDATASAVEKHIHHSQHHSVYADLGSLGALSGEPEEFVKAIDESERHQAHHYHHLAGFLALAVAALGFVFAYIIYRARLLSAGDAQRQFPGVHRFLAAKWYFDELYSVAIVRPGLAVAGWCRAFDTHVVDGIVNWVGRRTVTVSWVSGLCDKYVVDGLVNLLATVFQGVGRWLRTWQTGYLRSYVVFLVLAAMSLFALLYYFATQASAG